MSCGVAYFFPESSGSLCCHSRTQRAVLTVLSTKYLVLKCSLNIKNNVIIFNDLLKNIQDENQPSRNNRLFLGLVERALRPRFSPGGSGSVVACF